MSNTRFGFSRYHWQSISKVLKVPRPTECHVYFNSANAIHSVSWGHDDLDCERYLMTYDWDEAEALRKKSASNHVLLGPRWSADVSPESFGMAIWEVSPALTADDAMHDLGWVAHHLVRQGLILACVTRGLASDPHFITRFLARYKPVYVNTFGSSGGVILIGQIRPISVRPNAAEVAEMRSRIATATSSWLDAPAAVVPPSRGPLKWQTSYIDPARALELEPGSKVWDEVRTSLRGRRDAAAETPPLPLRQGHVALQLATGHLDGTIGTGEHRHVVTGRVIRRFRAPEEVVLADGRTEVTRLETLGIEIAAMGPDGTVYTYASAEEDGEED